MMGKMWMLPVSMVALNVAYVVLTLVAECRLKPNCLRFAFMYAATVPAAARGDLEPFTVVFTQPPA